MLDQAVIKFPEYSLGGATLTLLAVMTSGALPVVGGLQRVVQKLAAKSALCSCLLTVAINTMNSPADHVNK